MSNFLVVVVLKIPYLLFLSIIRFTFLIKLLQHLHQYSSASACVSCWFWITKYSAYFQQLAGGVIGCGCVVKKSESDSLATNYKLLSPTTRCSTHGASGSIKRMASTKTMSVEEVTTFARLNFLTNFWMVFRKMILVIFSINLNQNIC